MRKKPQGIDKIKERYGFIMISPWIFGMIVFFIIPIIQSVFYSFTDVSIEVGGTVTDFKGIANFRKILAEDPDYLKNLFSAFNNLLVSLPFILIVSMVLAILLNGKYRGRVFFRGIFFLPVIMASGAALQLFLSASGSASGETPVSDTATFGMMIDFSTVLRGLNMPSSIEKYISQALSKIFLLVWESGIQTILIIAGLQSIPDLLYEVSRVEGATKWEEFWFVTFPMLGRTMLLVIIFTTVEIVASSSNTIMLMAYKRFSSLEYGIGSSMLWFYFSIVGAVIAAVLLLYNKLFLRRWN